AVVRRVIECSSWWKKEADCAAPDQPGAGGIAGARRIAAAGIGGRLAFRARAGSAGGPHCRCSRVGRQAADRAPDRPLPAGTAARAWKQAEETRQNEVRRHAHAAATQEILIRQAEPVPRDFEKQFQRARKRYWDARLEYSRYLMRHDVETWRLLMPCDPVITV